MKGMGGMGRSVLAGGKGASPLRTPARMEGAKGMGGMRDMEMSSKQVENGYIVTRSGTTGKGANKQYESKQYVAKTLEECMELMKNGGMMSCKSMKSGKSAGGGMEMGGM